MQKIMREMSKCKQNIGSGARQRQLQQACALACPVLFTKEIENSRDISIQICQFLASVILAFFVPEWLKKKFSEKIQTGQSLSHSVGVS